MKHREHGFMNIGLSAEMKSGSNGVYADFRTVPVATHYEKLAKTSPSITFMNFRNRKINRTAAIG